MDTNQPNQAKGQQVGQAGGQGQDMGQNMGQDGSPAQGQQVGITSQQGQGTVTAQSRPGANVGVLRPPVDVIEDATGITLRADIPGVSKENLNLRLESHSLTIEGSLSFDLPPEMESRYAEVRHQHYERTFALSRELDGEKASAELAHGVLTIRIPKTAEAAPRKIPVNVSM